MRRNHSMSEISSQSRKTVKAIGVEERGKGVTGERRHV
jgi:hypothetical protein